ncbi:transglutaminase domain-containing protein [Streptosporangium carneum]|uniref:Transglutaminase-like domain-containing protein n=1 Tax=Streptosporangium carneum TaxID=47481 RepID=A0A9W6MAZ6_9ACTN|nr:transglutaminase domain-containing protein [Streptosporangium carneum]GLK07527.1 hypothetical protein GCM10017600_09320 [Streptosporangium carneum]
MTSAPRPAPHTDVRTHTDVHTGTGTHTDIRPRTRTRTRTRTDAVPAVVAVLLGLAPAVAFAGAFARTPAEALADPRYALPVAGACLVTAAACLVLASATRVAPVTRVTVAAALLAAYLGLAVPSAVLDGPRRLLTSAPPADPSGPELAFVVLVTGLATLGAVEPALRGRSAAWSMPSPLLATGAGLAVAAPSSGAAWLAPAVALSCGALLAVRARLGRSGVVATVPAPDDATAEGAKDAKASGAATGEAAGGKGTSRGSGGRAPWARPTALAPVLFVAVAVATSLAGPGLLALSGQRSPVDARDLVGRPVVPRQATSPLTQFPALLNGRLPMILSVTSAARPLRLRYATLTEFDGVYWTSAAAYWRAGTLLPAPKEDGRSETAQERVRVEKAGPVSWVVSSGRPVEVSVSGLGVDRESGDVVFPEDRSTPAEYTVRSAVPVVDGAVLETDSPAVPAADPASDRASGESAVRELTARAREITGDRRDYGALRRLSDHFAENGGFTVATGPDAPSGHGLFQINRLLEERRGTAEQYTSAFAAMARALGYDVRVAVGFRSEKPGQEGRYRISGRDVDAWAEVRFAESGWAPFFPTPARDGERRPDDPGSRSPEEQSAQERDPADTGDERRERTPARRSPASPPASPWRWWPLWLAAGAVLVSSAAAVPLSKAALRARRRRAADPLERVVGAWRDTLDRYAEAGLPSTAAATGGEVATGAAERFPAVTDAAHDLAEVVDRALYGSHAATAEDGDRAWALADAVRSRLRAALPRRRRLTAALRVPVRRAARSQGRSGAPGRSAAPRASGPPGPGRPPR